MVDLMKESLSQVDSMINTMKRFNEMTVGIMNKVITGSIKSWPNQPCPCDSASSEPHNGLSNDARIICPPQDNCPPRCLLTIIRHGYPGEVSYYPIQGTQYI